MSFLRLWVLGYRSPARYAEALRSAPAPRWGLYAVIARGLMGGLLLYLPLQLMGRVPPLRSYLAFLPTERYYGALVWLGPLVFLAHWLMAGGLTHVVLRLSGRASDMDVILNLSGMTALVVATILLAWDWLILALGWGNQYALGISHLIIDGWAIALSVVGLKRLLGVPTWLGIALNLVVIALWMPFGIMFMRSPL
ncbi:MAG: hypothetical protein V1772_03160 [Chloroflexota bacterium]